MWLFPLAADVSACGAPPHDRRMTHPAGALAGHTGNIRVYAGLQAGLMSLA